VPVFLLCRMDDHGGFSLEGDWGECRHGGRLEALPYLCFKQAKFLQQGFGRDVLVAIEKRNYYTRKICNVIICGSANN